MDYNQYFPYAVPRKEQRKAIEFAIDQFLKSNKRFAIIEAVKYQIQKHIQKVLTFSQLKKYCKSNTKKTLEEVKVK